MSDATNDNNDWLSAFRDGELGEADRADAQRRIDAHPHLIGQLNELDDLSAVLKSLPIHGAPGGFAEALRARLGHEETPPKVVVDADPELIAALWDGELSSSESARIERGMDWGTTDFAPFSYLAELPTVAPPADFTRSLLEMIASTRTSESSTTRDARPSRAARFIDPGSLGSVRAWWWTSATVLAASVVLFVTLQPLRSTRGARPEVRVALAPNETTNVDELQPSTQEGANLAAKKNNKQLADRPTVVHGANESASEPGYAGSQSETPVGDKRISRRVKLEQAPASPPPALSTRDVQSAAVADASHPSMLVKAATLPVKESQFAAPANDENHSGAADNVLDKLSRIKAGDLVSLNHQQISMVCVDVEKFYDRLHIVLAQHEAPFVALEPSEQRDKKAKNRLVVLEVSTSPSRLQEVLADLRHAEEKSPLLDDISVEAVSTAVFAYLSAADRARLAPPEGKGESKDREADAAQLLAHAPYAKDLPQQSPALPTEVPSAAAKIRQKEAPDQAHRAVETRGGSGAPAIDQKTVASASHAGLNRRRLTTSQSEAARQAGASADGTGIAGARRARGGSSEPPSDGSRPNESPSESTRSEIDGRLPEARGEAEAIRSSSGATESSKPGLGMTLNGRVEPAARPAKASDLRVLLVLQAKP